MIAPQDGQRGVLGAQHGLTRLVETIEALRRGQQQQQARDTTMQETRTSLAQQVGRVTRWSRHLRIAVGTLGGLSVLLAGLVGWQVWQAPQPEYARVLGAVDESMEMLGVTPPSGSPQPSYLGPDTSV